MTEWFEQWFGEEYLQLYPHRDDAEAVQMAALVAQQVPLAGRHMLDLACGPGRHARHFRQHGARVVGYDLSMPLLSRAKHRSVEGPLSLVRGDMRRLPFSDAAFDVVVNLFTSFGYFTDDQQHREVLREAARVLRASGMFVLDYLNPTSVTQGLVAHEERQVGEQRVAIERRISEDQRFVIKEIHLVDDGRSFVERVRLFSAVDLEAMLCEVDLTVLARYGDYSGRPMAPLAPRTILFAERP
jgi:SAM-dependent methyltransferase